MVGVAADSRRPRPPFLFCASFSNRSCHSAIIDPIPARPYHPVVQPVISAEQMREVDRQTTELYGISSAQLMQNAANACFQEIKNLYSANLTSLNALILCGPGNNGGDGAALALNLSRSKVKTKLLLFGKVKDLRGDAQTYFEQVRELGTSQTETLAYLSFGECTGIEQWEEFVQASTSYDFIVDALFGTGLSRPLEGMFASVVDHLNTLRAYSSTSQKAPIVISVDMPSGVNADLPNSIGPSVEADLTVTFTAPKAANVLPPVAHSNGRLVVAEIGSPRKLLNAQQSNLYLVERQDASDWLRKTRYTPGSFKNSHGHVLIVAGSPGFTGAAVLCGNAAMLSGAGLVTIATPAAVQLAVASAVMPEVMTAPLAETDRGTVAAEALAEVKRLSSRASVMAIGPGLSHEDERTRRFVYSAVEARTTPVILDADGLNCLAPWPSELRGSRTCPLVLTPHPGEMKRLLGSDEEETFLNRVRTVQEFSARHELIVVFKGSRTLIVTPERVFINPTGNAGLGTAGSGDTLTGIIAGFVAQARSTLKDSADISEAIIAAVYVAGLAGDFAAAAIGMRGMVASDIRGYLSSAFRSLDPDGERPSAFESLIEEE
jgi:ADP-dependent NAD(P)H-hydrate dehydratase / NAD(P)H-hydrate epimerase